MLKYKLYLNDVLRAISKIENSLKGKTKETFGKDDNLVDATSMRLQIIGESINKIPEDIKSKYKYDWEKLTKIRNIISHSYFKVNPELIWSLINEELAPLKNQIKKIKEDLK